MSSIIFIFKSTSRSNSAKGLHRNSISTHHNFHFLEKAFFWKKICCHFYFHHPQNTANPGSLPSMDRWERNTVSQEVERDKFLPMTEWGTHETCRTVYLNTSIVLTSTHCSKTASQVSNVNDITRSIYFRADSDLVWRCCVEVLSKNKK